MQSKQYELCQQVLSRLEQAGVLQHLVLVGSWCLVLYREYFRGWGTIHAIRTRDMDFLVPQPLRMPRQVNVPALLMDLGFITGWRGQEGVMLLEHPEVLIEFLVSEHGRSGDAITQLPKLGVNAQRLRYMDILTMKTLRLAFGKIPITAPHPAAFALHKLLVAPRRKNMEKKLKDLDAAIMVLELLEKKQEMNLVFDLLATFPKTWKRTIHQSLAGTRFADAI